MKRRLALGVDFGTESVRALVLDLVGGEELAEAVHAYPHGVIESQLPSTRQELGAGWALQHPADWLEGLERVVRDAMSDSGAAADDVIGIGIDFTACTVLPVAPDGTPLSLQPEWSGAAHAWPKLWKHHAAQAQADRITVVAETVPGIDLAAYGGRISSEWMLPKTLQVFEEAPDVFDAADTFVEALDWIVWSLTGERFRAAQVAGFKASYRAEFDAYPTARFLDTVSPGFSAVLAKISGDHCAPGACAGELSADWAARLGLVRGTPVAIGSQDAQGAVIASGAIRAGDMTLVMGTSICNLLLGDHRTEVAGMCGVVNGGIVAQLWAYEAGQAGGGDMLAWFARNAVPANYATDAAAHDRDTYQHLESLAAQIAPGSNPVLALDWWNGNRSILTDDHLSGLLVGLTLATKPQHIYRALLESLAFGQRTIVETFEKAGVPVARIIASGGLPHRSPLLMQLLADITGRPIIVSGTTQASARGSAMHAAVAAGAGAGGFDTIEEAAARLGVIGDQYQPDLCAHGAFSAAYADYVKLHDYFGREEAGLMHGLRERAAGVTHGSQVPQHMTEATLNKTQGGRSL